jgi:hypothetical protein
VLAISLILLLVALVFIILGIVFIVLGARGRRLAQSAAAWPTVAGVVTAAGLKKRVSVGTGPDYDHHDSFEPVVEYSYQVNERPYAGKRMSTGGAASYDRRRAQEILDRFPVGSSVNVFYDPADPAQSALEIKAGSGTALLVMGIVFLVLALIGCCVGGLLFLL